MDYSRWPEMQPHPPNPIPSTDPYAQFYNGQPSYSHYPYYSHQTHNPSLADSQTLLKHHEIPSAHYDTGPDAGLRPPGIDPYAAMSSYPPPIHVGFEGQSALTYGHPAAHMGALPAVAYHEDTDAAAQNWAAKEAVRQFGPDPIGYVPAITSLNKESVVSTSSTPVVWNNWNHPLANDAIRRTTKETDVMQIVRCEFCKIDCNSKDVYERHILGKKHQKNLQKHEESRNDSNVPITTTMHINPGTTMKGILPGEMGNAVSGKMRIADKAFGVGQDLESKRRKLVEGGAAVDSMRVCTICNVACNSEVVFNKHLAGKKHAIQAGLIPPSSTLLAANLNPHLWSNPKIRPLVNGAWKKGPKTTKIVQSAWCEICKIDCNSKDVLDKHKLGKKHKSNLEKLEESKKEASAPTAAAATVAQNPIIGPKENPAADKGKSVSMQQTKKKPASSMEPEEDLETKRRKVVEGGAAVGAVRVCTICNVVCNSQTVFNFHLKGQKHATMVKKQAEGIAAPGP